MSITSGQLNRIEALLGAPDARQRAEQNRKYAEVFMARLNGRVMTKTGEQMEFSHPGDNEGFRGHRLLELSVPTEFDKDTPTFTVRHTRMTLHEKQQSYWMSQARWNYMPCGRRSGKTEMVKRRRVRTGLRYPLGTRGKIVFGAPVFKQAENIFWDDLKLMVPKRFVTAISETDLTIVLYNGVKLVVTGLDEPRRIEGDPLLGIVLDEYGDMKPSVMDAHVRPALTETQGWADILGAPEGRNHYYDDVCDARADEESAVHHWTSEEILPLYLGEDVASNEIASAKKRMDPKTYEQEMLASFITFEGAAYYQFDPNTHVKRGLAYDSSATLFICFDFNVAPGVAVICQEQNGKTHCIGEIYIPRNSNTPMVCRAIADRWGKHGGMVHCYGDATGGAQGTNATEGSDWDLVKKYLRPVFPDRLKFKVQPSNPKERSRVNAVNSRLKAADGSVGVFVDGARCPQLVKDFEGVRVVEGGSGEIDKYRDAKLTHLTDALGYYIVDRFPVKGRDGSVISQY